MTHKPPHVDRRIALKLMGGAAAVLGIKEFASTAQATTPSESNRSKSTSAIRTWMT